MKLQELNLFPGAILRYKKSKVPIRFIGFDGNSIITSDGELIESFYLEPLPISKVEDWSWIILAEFRKVCKMDLYYTVYEFWFGDNRCLKLTPDLKKLTWTDYHQLNKDKDPLFITCSTEVNYLHDIQRFYEEVGYEGEHRMPVDFNKD